MEDTTEADVAAMAPGLGPCVNVFLLGKSDEEIRESFRPSGSGTYLISAEGEGAASQLMLLTVGAGSAVSGAWDEHHTMLVCWAVGVDIAAHRLGESKDVDCNAAIIAAWDSTSEVVQLSDLAEGS